jgi:hypothetical protein
MSRFPPDCDGATYPGAVQTTLAALTLGWDDAKRAADRRRSQP